MSFASRFLLLLDQQTFPQFVIDGTEVDTANHITPTPSGLTFDGGTSVWGETLFYLTDAETRVAGLPGIIGVSVTATNTKFVVGWRENTGGTYYGLQFDDDGLLYRLNDQAPDAPGLAVGAYGVADYEIRPRLRADGMFLYIKGGAFTDWTLLFDTLTGNDASLHLAVESFDAAFAVTNMQVLPVESVVVLASDSFNRASVGATDGAGHPEGGSGGGLTWVEQVATWVITSNRLRANTVVSSRAVVTVDVGKANVVMAADTASNGARIGFTLRYVDASNYISVVVLPANTAVRIYKWVAGVETLVAAAAISYVEGARLEVSIEGSAVRAIYNNLVVVTGTVADAGLQASTLHGAFAGVNGSVVWVDNLTIQARS